MAKFVIYSVLVLCFGMVAKLEHSIESAKHTGTTSVIEASECQHEIQAIIPAKVPSASYKEYLSVLSVKGPKEELDSRNTSKSSKEANQQNIKNELDELGTEDTIVEKIEVPNSDTFDSMPYDQSRVDHTPFGMLLKTHVNSQGHVNYQAFLKDRAKLESYIESLSKNTIQNSWSDNEKLAYYINVYNAYTIKLILDNYPVKSILDINNGKPWDLRFIKLGAISYTLNNIENDIIRKQFDEPRIHFAVNCAASSCPPLLNDAYYAESIDDQLERQTVAFINNSSYNLISQSELSLSKIFDWYSEDFGDVKSYVSHYSKIELKDSRMTFMEYDWSLNKK